MVIYKTGKLKYKLILINIVVKILFKNLEIVIFELMIRTLNEWE